MNQRFHQVELDDSSWAITTFSTPFGLYRYKHLTIRVNASPEHFHYVLQKACIGRPGWGPEYS